jgi:hypothetical protein
MREQTRLKHLTRDEIEEAIKASETCNDALRKLNLDCKSGSLHKTLKNYATKNNISFEHWANDTA